MQACACRLRVTSHTLYAHIHIFGQVNGIVYYYPYANYKVSLLMMPYESIESQILLKLGFGCCPHSFII